MNTNTRNVAAESALEELHAYAKLLFLRSGRQFEDKTYTELKCEVSPDESSGDIDSCKNTSFDDPEMDRLRREFLDRLSETVSAAKGGQHVVASQMFCWPDKIKVFVAINLGFAEGDALSEFLRDLCTILKGVATAPDNQIAKHTNALWDMLLCHQVPRLNALMVNLRQIMKNFQHLLPQHFAPEPTNDDICPNIDGVLLDFEACLKLLAGWLFCNGKSDFERHDKLVNFGHVIYRTFPAKHFQVYGRAGDKLHQAIGLLGRLKTSFRALVAAARHMSGFDDLSLIPVISLKTRRKPLTQEWSLGKTFQALNLQLSHASVGQLMEPSRSKVRWTRNKLLSNFSRLKSPTWEVHAEIQLVLFILSHPGEVVNGRRVDYIGCSRYSCVLCFRFLHNFRLETRGCHGKLYNHSWTLPLGDNLEIGEQHMLSKAVTGVIQWMRKELTTMTVSSAQRKLEVKESTIGGGSIVMPGNSQENRQQSHAAVEHIHRQRAEISNVHFNKESLPELSGNIEPSGVQNRHETLSNDSSNLCTSCGEVETTRRCSYCGGALFCSKTCERAMALSHLLKCSMRKVTSADYLYQDVLEDELPTDPQVRKDYWFDLCQNKNEESYLLGVFIGLVHYHPNRVMREELHQWRLHQEGNPYLVAKIVEKFEELSINSRGGYFPWFLRHRARFEQLSCPLSVSRTSSPAAKVQSMLVKARKYLAPEDQDKDVEDLTPFSKMHSFMFYSMILESLYPPPTNREHCLWFDFGFVVTHNEHEERELGSLYNAMLFGSMSHEDYERGLGSSTMVKWSEWINKSGPVCSFDEFWKAWERGKLMTMFDKRWPDSPKKSFFKLPQDCIIPRLKKFLDAETPRPSIWRLRHFLAMENVSVESAVSVIAQAARDYGFSEQLDIKTTMELRHLYVQLLKKAEPLAVHQERRKGNILQLAESHISIITPRVKNILLGLC